MIPDQPELTVEEMAWTVAAVIALVGRPPKATWELEPHYDYQTQRLSRETMIDQLCDRAARVDANIRWMLGRWAETGKLPSRRRDEGAFLRLALVWSAQHYNLTGSNPGRWPGACPTPGAFSALVGLVWGEWKAEEMGRWATSVAEDRFRLQEFIHDSYDPLY
jgi:hypothetical protein